MKNLKNAAGVAAVALTSAALTYSIVACRAIRASRDYVVSQEVYPTVVQPVAVPAGSVPAPQSIADTLDSPFSPSSADRSEEPHAQPSKHVQPSNYTSYRPEPSPLSNASPSGAAQGRPQAPGLSVRYGGPENYLAVNLHLDVDCRLDDVVKRFEAWKDRKKDGFFGK